MRLNQQVADSIGVGRPRQHGRLSLFPGVAAFALCLALCVLSLLLCQISARTSAIREDAEASRQIELLLTEDDVPEGWVRQFAPYVRRHSDYVMPLVPFEVNVRYVHNESGAGATHTVAARRDASGVRNTYEREVAYRGGYLERYPAWEPMAGWDYCSALADQCTFWAVVTGDEYYARVEVMVVARYGRYISRLWITGPLDSIEVEHVQHLILAGDRPFADGAWREGG